jgi:hypothetical protein
MLSALAVICPSDLVLGSSATPPLPADGKPAPALRNVTLKFVITTRKTDDHIHAVMTEFDFPQVLSDVINETPDMLDWSLPDSSTSSSDMRTEKSSNTAPIANHTQPESPKK